MEKVIQFFHNEIYVVGIFGDFTKAFDTVDNCILRDN